MFMAGRRGRLGRGFDKGAIAKFNAGNQVAAKREEGVRLGQREGG